jgi:phage terminase large subunit
MDEVRVDAQFPEKLLFLFEPGRYKVAYGGRGGAKSWGFARALLIEGLRRPLRILCAREIQDSIEDSVKRLLEDQIEALGLGHHYTVLKTHILGANGTLILFSGLKHKIKSLKSLEAVDIVWVEEAQTVTASSWDILIPTIRKQGSEIWISFNPELESDETFQRFVVHRPPNAIVVKIGWADNPWFPETLHQERKHLEESDPDKYLHIWEGNCKQVLDGAIYANELRAVDREGRILRVPYDHSKPVSTFWDLGYGDMTAVWFVQAFAFEYRIIDYLEGSQQPLAHYLKALSEKPYLYSCHHLPHDAEAHTLGTGKSVRELMRAAGFKTSIVAKLSISQGINAARTIFPQCYFDRERCADGLQALRHYTYGEAPNAEVDPRTNKPEPKREPLHNWASHPADAFRMFAVGIKPPPPKSGPRKPPPLPAHAGGDRSWMT